MLVARRPDEELDGLPTPRRYWAVLSIALGITVAVLDTSIANIALPTMARQLRATPAAATWIVNAYQLVNVVALLPLASLGEKLGYRRVYLAGLATFTLGSLACALSGTLATLVASRVLQGLGAAGIMSVNGALVRHTFPIAILGRGVGLNALVVSIAAAAGPTLAATILSIASWPWLFAINVPFVIVNLVIAARALPSSARSGLPFDWRSAGLNAVAFGLLFIGTDELSKGGAVLPIGGCELATACVAGFLLLRRANRTERPLVPVDLMRSPLFALSVTASVCAFCAYSLVFLAMPFLLRGTPGRDLASIGLLMTPWPVALGLVAPIAGRLADRFPAAIIGSAGLFILTAGILGLASMPPSAPSVAVACWMALGGLGFGLFQSPNNRTLLGSAPRARAGAAGGMLAVARLLGMTLGAMLAAVTFRLAGASAEKTELLLACASAFMGVVVSASRVLAAPKRAAVA